MLKTTKRIVAILLITPLIINAISIGRLALTDNKVANIYFTPYYFVKINSDEHENIIFDEYMSNKGWKFYDQMGCVKYYKKGQQKKTILCTNIKTVIINGKIQFQEFPILSYMYDKPTNK